ncbi:MAG: tRNA epoxyqueuosine(34) reductase QueG [Acidimicrobiales bacterium]|nr:tRNA epoxyqueuosine(34) reductase QueG [Acidimicrobiales bacterium]MDG1845832.1 tRNA epoxyqueuosine(34) reductase QueG [Acidimicrobiales bacterium]
MGSSLSMTQLRQTGLEHGLDSIGVAKAEIFASTRDDLMSRKEKGLHGTMEFTYRNPERSTDPSRTLKDAETLIVGARSYWRTQSGTVETNEPIGRVALYAQEDHYQQLRRGLEAIAGLLKEHGYKARILVDDNALVDREAAFRAGIGWYGKNTNLLLPKRGSWFVLGTVVTNAKYDPQNPHGGSCGSCEQCIPACPTQAITSAGVLDANRCLAWLVQSEGQFPIEFREALGDRIYGCDDCQTVCPVNRREERSNEKAVANSDNETVLIHEMLDMKDEELLQQFGTWYIPKRDPRYLRRNALLVLGNKSGPPSGKTKQTVHHWLQSDDDMIRSHAVWTAKRLGLTELLTPLADDPSPLVQAELEQAVRLNYKPSIQVNTSI